ncbi:glycine--tRNA ligase subunit beta [Porphyrobacter sp. SLTP]|uniref:glycine--tRNA ligase subunit beta n=1 Tax=Porphyrobacter sp. SLTP TaxID=2683266 RepID=UPI001411EFD9|nr:glycine--tRNA ligase subunit beta [Porphyrobacter sp. SLTP]NBB24917.1 glycine--tRNA ligase subunit beta [Porphyrobacter sp. SLTP]
MADFLLELRCEEIPARMQPKAKEDLARLFADALAKAGLPVGEIETFATPRRLALIAKNLPLATEPVSEETKGPKVGAPPQALDGFLRKVGLSEEQLVERDGVYFAVIEKPGRDTAAVLAEAIPAIIRAFPWPKSMRWGAASLSTESLRWVRPLSGIIALLDGAVVPCEIDGIASGRTTMGHRFHHSGPVTIADAGSYIETLRAAHVVVHFSERCALIRDGAAKVAAEAGLTLVADEGLVIENAGLTEWPVPLLGRFDEAFLDVPPEVIQLTARVNQKYFVCKSSPSGEGDRDPKGRGGEADAARPSTILSDGPPPRAGEDSLANAFVCTANIDAIDPAVVVDGNRKVLAARLSDARFFWEQDQKTSLAEHAKKLSRITFHEKLGTVADKVERVAKLARWLCEDGIVTDSPFPPGEGPGMGGATPRPPHTHPQPLPSREGATLADLAEQAARLCKADLVTEMVGEFPELQGLMGGYYAAKEGLPVEVSDAIRDHYKPVGQGDEVPTAPVTVAVSLADKLDTLLSFFAIDEKPTGSKDPFALRRAALGIIQLIQVNSLRLRLSGVPLRWFAFFDHLMAQDLAARLRLQIRVTIFGKPHPHDERKLFFGLSPAAFLESYEDTIFIAQHGHIEGSVLDFFADRLKVQQREAGVRHDLIDAVFALGGEDDLVRLLARVHALQAFVTTEDGTNLLAGYKRAANILKKENYPVTPAKAGASGGNAQLPEVPAFAGMTEQIDGIEQTGEEDPLAMVDDPDIGDIVAESTQTASALSYTPEPAEKALIDALDAAAPRAAQAVEGERFADAMAALATLRAPIDRFFEEVTVNAEEAEKRQARLALLARFRDAVHRVADFSRIEG